MARTRAWRRAQTRRIKRRWYRMRARTLFYRWDGRYWNRRTRRYDASREEAIGDPRAIAMKIDGRYRCNCSCCGPWARDHARRRAWVKHRHRRYDL